MRILFAEPDNYFAVNGGTKANRSLVEGLVQHGHFVCVITTGKTYSNEAARAKFINEMLEHGFVLVHTNISIDTFKKDTLEIHIVSEDLTGANYCSCIIKQILAFKPTHVLISEDLTYVPLALALETTTVPVVFICHSPLFLPFGPQSALKSDDPSKLDLLKQADGIITVSNYVKDYMKEYGSLESSMLRFPSYGRGPFPQYSSFDTGFVSMINPSQIKGICIFAELARNFPEVPFAVVPTWATNAADYDLLGKLDNVKIFKPFDNIDDLYAQTHILLTPSLWGEAFGQVVVEAMLRGIPVLASDAGALAEAKLGVDYCLPVNPILGYEEKTDDIGLPIPKVPKQDVHPWIIAMAELLGDRKVYERISVESRNAATRFVNENGVEKFEYYLQMLPKKKKYNGDMVNVADEAGSLAKRIGGLTTEQKAILLRKMKT